MRLLASNEFNTLYKSPIMPSTKAKYFDFLDNAVEYIKGLKFPDDELATDHDRKVIFKGFISNIENVKSIYNQFVETGELKTFPVRSTNQDPVESFFSRCRSSSAIGNNTSPTIQQFSAAILKLLVTLGKFNSYESSSAPSGNQWSYRFAFGELWR